MRGVRVHPTMVTRRRAERSSPTRSAVLMSMNEGADVVVHPRRKVAAIPPVIQGPWPRKGRQSVLLLHLLVAQSGSPAVKWAGQPPYRQEQGRCCMVEGGDDGASRPITHRCRERRIRLTGITPPSDPAYSARVLSTQNSPADRTAIRCLRSWSHIVRALPPREIRHPSRLRAMHVL